MIFQKNSAEIERIRASCHVVFQVQQAIAQQVRPGVTTRLLDELAERVIRTCGGVPAFKGYRGFPASICASVNSAAVHGFPGDRPLRRGDILSVDVGVALQGFYGDGAFTMGVGPIKPDRARLLATTRACLEAGISQARAGGRLSNISHAIQACAEAAGFCVIREFGGHGIGRELHEDPHIANFGRPGLGPRLRPGYVLAIEPIIGLGEPEIEVAKDGWTALTRDRSPVAHFEHTVAVTTDGPDILTLPAGCAEAASCA